MQKHIVVAEDEIVRRNRNARLLRREGYDVFKAEDGLKAWEHISANGLDLLVTDIEMPGMGGYDLIRTLQMTGRENTPVIVIAQEFDIYHVNTYPGIVEYFQKPLTGDKEREFVEKVVEILGN